MDVLRVAFVTRRFNSLQGLRTVADALPALIFGAGRYWARSYLDVILLFGSLAAYVALRVTWIRSRIEDYYSRRLGRVEPSGANRDPTLLFGQFHPRGRIEPGGSNFEGIFLFYQGLVFPVGQDIPVPVLVQIGLAGSMLAFQPLRVLIRDWRYRPHWLLPLGVAVAYAWGLATVASAREIAQLRVLVCVSGGAALAIAGVCDHLLLVKALGGGSGATSAVEYVDHH